VSEVSASGTRHNEFLIDKVFRFDRRRLVAMELVYYDFFFRFLIFILVITLVELIE
jgi:hypothetical protein